MSEINIMSLDLNLLTALDVLLETCSVTKAADRQSVSQSAMSHTLRRIREAFNDEILIRSGDGMVPTKRAEALRPQLRGALLDLNRAINGSPVFNPDTDHRRFVIAGNDYFSMVVLPRLWSQIRTIAPNVRLDVGEVEPMRAHQQLESGDADAAFGIMVGGRVQKVSDGDTLNTRKMMDETFVSIVRKDHPVLASGLTLESFLSLDHALISPSRDGTSVVDTALAKLGKTRHVAVRVPHFVAAPILVAKTDLVLTLPRRIAQTMAEYAPLQVLDTPLDLPGYTHVLLWHRRFSQDAGHQWLREQVALACQ